MVSWLPSMACVCLSVMSWGEDLLAAYLLSMKPGMPADSLAGLSWQCNLGSPHHSKQTITPALFSWPTIAFTMRLAEMTITWLQPCYCLSQQLGNSEKTLRSDFYIYLQSVCLCLSSFSNFEYMTRHLCTVRHFQNNLSCGNWSEENIYFIFQIVKNIDRYFWSWASCHRRERRVPSVFL